MIDGSKILDHPIRWALIGGGKGARIGINHRNAAMRDYLYTLVAGAFDINPERGMAFGKDLGLDPERCYPDYQTMFEKEAMREDGIEGVSVATPNGTHYTITKAALEAGLHVICEKPLCFTSEEAEELVALAREKKRIIGITYAYAGHELIQQARQMIKHGDLGKIRLVNMSFACGGLGRDWPSNAPNSLKWRFDPKQAGPSAVLGDVGTHPLFIMEAMIPDLEVDDLLCTTKAYCKGHDLEDNAFTIMNLKGTELVQEGAQVYCWSSFVNQGGRHTHKIRVIGEEGSIEWNDEFPNQMLWEREGKGSITLERGAGYLYDDARVEDRVESGHSEGLLDAWSNLYRRFAIAMTNSDAVSEYTDFWYPSAENGLFGVKWIEKCVESQKKGSIWVKF